MKEIADTFGVDWPHLIAQIISFCIVCFLLHRFAYRPVLQTLYERSRNIAQGIAERETIKVELAQAEARKREILIEASAQATRVIDEAHKAAALVREKEMQKATITAEQIILKSRQQAAQERDHMLADLKREIGTLVVEATTTITGKILTADDQRRMAEETLSQLSKAA